MYNMITCACAIRSTICIELHCPIDLPLMSSGVVVVCVRSCMCMYICIHNTKVTDVTIAHYRKI